jgi:iron(III) transport system permease protein
MIAALWEKRPRISVPRALAVLLLVAVSALVLSPLVYLLSVALKPDALHAVSIKVVALLALKSLSLAMLSTLWAMLLALPLAWFVIRTDLPFRNFSKWIAVIPLAIPSYIGALTYIALLGPVGTVNTWLSKIPGVSGQWVNIYGYWGGIYILGLFTYPYIFLLVCGALEATNPAIEETARSLGESPAGVFRRITLPMLRPSIMAGALLAFLYALSDFGSLSLLRVHVFTTEIYHQLNTRFDQAASSMLSFVLVFVTLAVLIGQRLLLGRRSYVTVTGTARLPRPVALGRWRLPAFLITFLILGLSVFLPLGVLVSQAGSWGHIADIFGDQWGFLKNSLWTASLAALIAAGLSLLIASITRRFKNRAATRFSALVQMGYAIPGTVLGLSLILLYNTYVPWLYGTIAVLIVAYLIRFLTQSLQGVESALGGINPHLEEAARSLAASHGRVLLRVLAPLLRPTLFAVWVLVFISAMKELDATLLLRPPGFDTLPVRVYIHTVEAEYSKAAALSLVLIAFTALPWVIVTRLRERKLL